MLEYVYVCRHGFRSNWVDPSVKTGPTGMPRDPPLAAYGLDQAHHLSAFLSSPTQLAPHPVPQAVFSSPFYRCIQTAVPTNIALKSGGRVVDATLGVAGWSKTDEELGIASAGRSAAGEMGGESGPGAKGIMLDHGAMEWYSPTKPNTGLHPRPADPARLEPLFPGQIDLSYTSTVYPSRRGELLKDLHDRADLFVEAWTSRVEEMGYTSVVLFSHAAAVIAIGRALTGDKHLEVSAGCASTSLYRRKRPNAGASAASSRELPKENAAGSLDGRDTKAQPQQSIGEPCGVGEWEPVYIGRADYLEKGVERDWSFRDAVFVNGEVIYDDGDHLPHPPEDTIPNGLADGMEKYLRRGRPERNSRLKELEQGVAVGKGKM